MCAFPSKDYPNETDAYRRQPQSHYDPTETASTSSPSPHQGHKDPHHYKHYHRHHQHHRDNNPRQYTPPQTHTESNKASQHNSHSEPTGMGGASFDDSSSASDTQKGTDTESPRTRSGIIRVPCSVRPQHRGSFSGAPGQSTRRNDDTEQLSEALKSIVELKEFLASAPAQFSPGEFIRQFRLPSEEQISCVRWRQVFCITGTDIVRALVFRFSVFGREVINRKKFEEGVFSDLRNLKINVDATLENPKSELLELLYKHHCVRTKKKQKVFFWYSVQHDQLFIDTLERELKREEAYKAEMGSNSRDLGVFDDPYSASGSPASTRAVREPALSFQFNSAIPLIEQVSSISKDLPSKFATLIEATTSGPNTASADPPSTFGTPTSAMPIPRHSINSHSHTRTSNHRDYEYAYMPHPLTPTQSADKVSGHDFLLSPGFAGRQHALYATPDLITGMPTPTSNDASGTSAKTAWDRSTSYGTHSQSDLAIESTDRGSATSLVRQNSIKSEPDDSDFPLDLLVQHDYEHQKPLEDTSFHNKYHDFVYNNRPALASSSSLAPSPFSAPTGPGLSFAASEWPRESPRAEAVSPSDESRALISPYLQQFPPLWSRLDNHGALSLDSPFDYRTFKAGRRGSGRITKYTNAHLGVPSVPGGTYTDGY